MLRYGIAAPHPSRAPYANGAGLCGTKNENGSIASYFLRLRSQDSCDDVSHAVPIFGFCLQAAFPCRCERVVFRFALIFRLAPFARDPALVFEAIERGIERALLDFQAVLRDLLNAKKNTVAVEGAERDGFKYEHIEGALQKVELFVHSAVGTQAEACPFFS